MSYAIVPVMSHVGSKQVLVSDCLGLNPSCALTSCVIWGRLTYFYVPPLFICGDDNKSGYCTGLLWKLNR